MAKIEIASVEAVRVSNGRYVYTKDGREYHVYRYGSHGVEQVSVHCVWSKSNGRDGHRSVTGTKTGDAVVKALEAYELAQELGI